ncbi:TetR/AcrR family transcriptional regulator [Arthrobacter sp. R4]|uniref:TetR/AcrR family transcriptional regulator n=1 Tax=Arthrobacter sp. R4 TaxID=644417 RepID=UPI003EDB5ABD
MGDTNERKWGNGREALVRAAIDVVAEEGLDALSFRKVALRAGVNNTLITHHFGSKDALLEAAAEWATEKSQQFSELTNIASPIDEEFAAGLVGLVTDDPNLQVFQYYMALAARRSPQLQKIAETLHESYIEGIARTLEHYGYKGDRAAAHAVYAALDGLVFHQLTVPRIVDTKAAIVRLGNMLQRH